MTQQDQLSIRLLPGGFSYSWGDRPADYIALAGKDPVAAFEDAVLSRQELLRAWDVVVCEVHTSRVAVLSAALSPDEARAHCSLLLPEAGSEEMLFCDTEGDIAFWFGADARLCHFMQRTFLNVVYRHPLCSLHAFWQTKTAIGHNARMVADASLSALHLLVYSGGILRLAVRHETGDLRNMAYHILNTWQQLALDPQNDLLVLTGDSTLCSKLHDQTQEIIKNIQ